MNTEESNGKFENENLQVIKERQGVNLICTAKLEDGVLDVFRVGVSWHSVKQMMRDLKYGNTFIIKDRSLLVRKKDEEISLDFRSRQTDLGTVIKLTKNDLERLLELLKSYIPSN